MILIDRREGDPAFMGRAYLASTLLPLVISFLSSVYDPADAPARVTMAFHSPKSFPGPSLHSLLRFVPPW